MTPEEFTARFLPLGEGLYRIGLSLLESQEEARDAVQDVFLKMWTTRDSLDAVRDPRAWSYILMRNLCVAVENCRNDRQSLVIREPVDQKTGRDHQQNLYSDDGSARL